MTDEPPLFTSDVVRVPGLTYDDLVAFYQSVMDMRCQLPVDPFPSSLRVPAASDRSAYAEFCLTGRYRLSSDVEARAQALLNNDPMWFVRI